MEVATTIQASGGFATTESLKSSGFSEAALTSAVRSGGVHRLRRGHYSTVELSDPRVVAARAGGRLTGLSAIEAMGGWVWRRPARVQVALAPHASRLHQVEGVDLRWGSDDESGGSPAIVSIASALVRAALDAPLESAVAAFDWALHTGAVTRMDFEAVLLRLPDGARSITQWIDPASQSVLESVARVRILRRGWSVQSQTRVGDLSAIDLVVEGHVALELDGREFHESSFEADRIKDLQIAIEGRHSLRVSASILSRRWSDVERAIAASLAARRNGDAGFSGAVPAVPKGCRRHPPLEWPSD